MCKALRALPANTSPEICFELIQDPTFVEERLRQTERRTHYVGVKKMLNDVIRDLQSNGPGLLGNAGLQETVADPPQSTSDSEASYAPLSVDCSSPSLTDISVADGQ